MHVAANVGTLSCINVLSKHSANINAQDNAGCTPLQLAVDRRHVKAISALLNAGARVVPIDGRGFSMARMMAMLSDLPDARRMLQEAYDRQRGAMSSSSSSSSSNAPQGPPPSYEETMREQK